MVIKLGKEFEDQLMKDNMTLNSLAFILQVTRDPLSRMNF